MKEEVVKKASLKWIIWGILCLCYVIVNFQRFVMSAVQGDIISDFNLTNAAFANIGAAYFYAYFLMQIPTGIMVDTIGTRFTATAGMLLAGIGTIVFSVSSSFGFAFSGRLIAGIGLAVIFISIVKTIIVWFDQKLIATIMGLTIFTGAMGGVLSQTPLIITLKYLTWREFFFGLGIFCLILSLSIFVLLKEKRENNKKEGFSKKIDASSIINQILLVIKNKHTWPPFFLFAGIFGSLFAIAGIWGPKIFCSYPGITEIAAGNIAVAGLLGNAIGMLFMGMISDKLGKRKLPVLISSSVNLALWLVLILFGKNLAYINLCILVFLIGVFSAIAAIAIVIGKEVNDPAYSGMSSSVVNSGGFFGAIIVPIAIGLYYDNYINADFSNALYICMISAVIGLIASALVQETNCKNVFDTKNELFIEEEKQKLLIK